MLSQLLNIEWDITNVMLIVILLLGIAVLIKFSGKILNIFVRTNQNKNKVKKEFIKKDSINIIDNLKNTDVECDLPISYEQYNNKLEHELHNF